MYIVQGWTLCGGQISPVKGFKLTKFFCVRYSGVEKSVNITSIVMINMIKMIMIIMGMISTMINMIIIIMAMIRMMMNVAFMDGGCASAIPLISATRKERRNKGRKIMIMIVIFILTMMIIIMRFILMMMTIILMEL